MNIFADLFCFGNTDYNLLSQLKPSSVTSTPISAQQPLANHQQAKLSGKKLLHYETFTFLSHNVQFRSDCGYHTTATNRLASPSFDGNPSQ